MGRLLAIAAIVVAGAAIFLVAREGGSSDAGSKQAAAAQARARAEFGSGDSRPGGGKSGRPAGASKPSVGSKAPGGGAKAPSAAGPRHAAPAAQKQLTRKQFIRQADAICRGAHEQVGGIGRKLLKIGVAAAKGRLPQDVYYARSAALTYSSQGIALRAIDDLKALPGPSDRRIDQYLATSATQARLLGDQAEALQRHDPRTVQELNLRLVKLSRRSQQLAVSYGFHVCGGAGDSGGAR